MPPLRMHPSRDATTPAAPRPQQPAVAGTSVRQFKILQSNRAPAQLTLGLRRAA